ncbi:MAG: radical SAM protein [Nanobdellota archaeon]
MREGTAQKVLVEEQSDLYSCTHSLHHYEGCSLGCLYCPTSEPVAYSNAPTLVLRELAGFSGAICIGDGQEPYPPEEQELRLTRRVLEVLAHHDISVHIITKSTLAIRDRDLFAKMNVCVSFSFASIDKKLAAILEPNAPPPQDRLDSMRRLVNEGICCGVVFMPILPYITDTPEHIEGMFKAAKDAGASFLIDSPLQLTGKEQFFAKMEEYPRLRRFLKRYQRLYKNHSVPYGKVMQDINKLCFDMSNKYGMPRRWNLSR